MSHVRIRCTIATFSSRDPCPAWGAVYQTSQHDACCIGMSWSSTIVPSMGPSSCRWRGYTVKSRGNIRRPETNFYVSIGVAVLIKTWRLRQGNTWFLVRRSTWDDESGSHAGRIRCTDLYGFLMDDDLGDGDHYLSFFILFYSTRSGKGNSFLLFRS